MFKGSSLSKFEQRLRQIVAEDEKEENTPDCENATECVERTSQDTTPVSNGSEYGPS